MVKQERQEMGETKRRKEQDLPPKKKKSMKKIIGLAEPTQGSKNKSNHNYKGIFEACQ